MLVKMEVREDLVKKFEEMRGEDLEHMDGNPRWARGGTSRALKEELMEGIKGDGIHNCRIHLCCDGGRYLDFEAVKERGNVFPLIWGEEIEEEFRMLSGPCAFEERGANGFTFRGG
jgi:hypothetical protein